tara:strand:- start:463 stop:1065 length:603 start_codon:yes stop_codon:yes gene_type:complete
MRLITNYKVFKKVVDIPDYMSSYIYQESKKGDPIFNNKYDENSGDGKRSQYDFNCKIGIHFKQILRKFIKTKGFLKHKHYIKDLVIVRSEPFCKRQKLHIDYDMDKLRNMKKNNYPYGMIVGVSNNSRFLISNNQNRIKTIYINKGDVIIFRGDLVHAGAEYYSENVRLHAYIDSVKYKREKNITYIPKLDDDLVVKSFY